MHEENIFYLRPIGLVGDKELAVKLKYKRKYSLFMIDSEVQKTRSLTYDINPVIVNRWSPRSFVNTEIADKELFSLFEAARWAPSSSNSQPWRFIYAKRDSKNWNTLFNLLIDFNKQWCTDASVLVVIISRKNFENNGQPSLTHQFDTGAAWENLAIQAVSQGLDYSCNGRV